MAVRWIVTRTGSLLSCLLVVSMETGLMVLWTQHCFIPRVWCLLCFNHSYIWPNKENSLPLKVVGYKDWTENEWKKQPVPKEKLWKTFGKLCRSISQHHHAWKQNIKTVTQDVCIVLFKNFLTVYNFIDVTWSTATAYLLGKIKSGAHKLPV